MRILNILLLASIVMFMGCAEKLDVKKLETVLPVARAEGNIIGSAVVVKHVDNYYYLLTCEHVIKDESSLYILVYGNLIKITDTYIHKTQDIAVVRIQTDLLLQTAELSENFTILDEVYSVGYPLGLYRAITQGIINYPFTKDSGDAWTCSAPAFSGNSGGGVFTKDGQLIGISVALGGHDHIVSVVLVPHLHVFIPVKYITDWLEETCAR